MKNALSPKDYWERPWVVRLLLFVITVGLTVWIDLTDTLLGRALTPVVASVTGAEGGFVARLQIGIVLGAVVVGNVAIVRLMPFFVQIGVIWAELLVLILAFFYSFELSFPFIFSRLGFLVFQGAVTTIYISLLSIAIASVIAMAAALARLSSSAPAYAVATFYISFFRGTPLLLQVYLIYLGLPRLGLVLDALPSGVIALSLCYGAYMAEIFRASKYIGVAARMVVTS